jgi:hypothetical protein
MDFHGIPQGSVLGPLLLNTYINDFSTPINQISDAIMFADDTSILISSNNCTDLNQVCTVILSHIAKWFPANQLVLNVEKTNMINDFGTHCPSWHIFKCIYKYIYIYIYISIYNTQHPPIILTTFIHCILHCITPIYIIFYTVK